MASTKSSLYLYTVPFHKTTDSQFWDILIQTLSHPPTSLSNQPLILISSYQLKQWLYTHLTQTLPPNTPLPQISTLDELLLNNSPYNVTDTSGLNSVMTTLTKNKENEKNKPHFWFNSIKNTKGFANQIHSFHQERQHHQTSPEDYINAHPSPHIAKQNIDYTTTIQSMYTSTNLTPLTQVYTHINDQLDDQLNDQLNEQKKDIKETSNNWLNQWANRPLFILGFWHIPQFQIPLLSHLITQAQTTSCLINADENKYTIKTVKGLIDMD